MQASEQKIPAHVTLEHDDEVAVVVIDNPPVNALSAGVRAGIMARLEEALADPEVAAIVLICAGRTFVAGADISEFGKPAIEPHLPDVLGAIEASRKPVIAAVHGTALGGGFELALACHSRVATRDARFGLPEVGLGIVPGAGGTQRLPRLVGIERALPIIVLGERTDGKAALEAGIVDALAPDAARLRETAIAHAIALLEEPPEVSLRRLSRQDEKLEAARADRSLLQRFREKNAKRLAHLEAPEAAIACVEAGLERSFEEALAFERETFLRLRDSAQARALRYAFFAEREAAKVPDIGAGIAPRPISHVGIVGAGTMGTGIAMAFLNAGLPVTIVETREEALSRGLSTIAETLESAVARGRITSDEAARRRTSLDGSLAIEDLAQVDLVVEAAFETMEVKREVFGKLDRVMKPGAILATNTSYLDVDEIARATSRPGDVIGLHFFSPAHIMKLLEVVRGEKSAVDAVATGMALAKRLGKVGVCVGVGYGFVGNRMLARRQEQATRLVLEGAMPWDVDRVLVAFGLPMGPFAMSDLAGLDLGWSRETSRGETLKERLCERDRRGQKTKAGFYDYDEARRPTPSPVTEEIVLEMAREKGIARRPIADAEILERCLYPMIAEGARILEEGKAIRASDIDVVWINGYGFPRWRGGPMFYADEVGLPQIVEALARYEALHGEPFAAPRLLVETAERGGRITG